MHRVAPPSSHPKSKRSPILRLGFQLSTDGDNGEDNGNYYRVSVVWVHDHKGFYGYPRGNVKYSYQGVNEQRKEFYQGFDRTFLGSCLNLAAASLAVLLLAIIS